VPVIFLCHLVTTFSTYAIFCQLYFYKSITTAAQNILRQGYSHHEMVWVQTQKSPKVEDDFRAYTHGEVIWEASASQTLYLLPVCESQITQTISVWV